MASAKQKTDVPEKIPFYLLVSLLIIIPLIFTNNIDNGFELTKAVSLKIFGGLFILSVFVFMIIPKRAGKSIGCFIHSR